MSDTFYHDYETFNRLNIKQVDAEAYVRDPSLEIFMMPYATNNGLPVDSRDLAAIKCLCKVLGVEL